VKKIVWKTPNKMKIETGHGAFDRQTNVIATGNCITNTQISSFIRARKNVVNPVGEIVPEGYLQDFDLKKFSNLPDKVRKVVKQVAVEEPVILYEFFHRNRGKRIVHGYVITDSRRRLIEWFVTGPTYKSYKVIAECVKYVSEDWLGRL